MLKTWLAYFHAGVELLAMPPRPEIVEQLVADMSERFRGVKAEPGLARRNHQAYLSHCKRRRRSAARPGMQNAHVLL